MCSAKNNQKAHFLYMMGNELSANKISDDFRVSNSEKLGRSYPETYKQPIFLKRSGVLLKTTSQLHVLSICTTTTTVPEFTTSCATVLSQFLILWLVPTSLKESDQTHVYTNSLH